mgnify:CR=1 FL=1
MRWEDLHRHFAEPMQRRAENRYEFRPPGGESYSDVEDRARPFIEALRQTHPRGSIAMVAHAMINRVLVRLLLGMSRDEMFELQQDGRRIYQVCIRGEQRRLEFIDAL